MQRTMKHFRIFDSLVFWVLVLIGLLRYSEAAPSTQREDRIWKAKMTACEQTVCNHLLKDENYNCLNNCTSTYCYQEIYSAEPLEDGEIDYGRDRKFKNCLRKEIKSNNIEERNKRRKAEEMGKSSGDRNKLNRQDNSQNDEELESDSESESAQ